MDYSFTQINSVTFKLLSKSEAKKLSVLPISSVQTFDLLGHPLDNGLCDTALGKQLYSIILWIKNLNFNLRSIKT